MSANVLRSAILVTVMVSAGLAQAQTKTAYQVGLGIAQKRGYANADCYAKVFARHAVVTENANRQRNWFAASTPAYNADQLKTCGVDRLANTAPQRALPAAPASAGYTSNSGYAAGLNGARKSGYTGADAACYAKVYATYASQYPSAGGPGTWAIDGRSVERFRLELHSTCRISR